MHTFPLLSTAPPSFVSNNTHSQRRARVNETTADDLQIFPPKYRSRYFRCLNGKDYKWKIGSHRMEVRPLSSYSLAVFPSQFFLFSQCFDGRSTILAIWEVSTPDQEHYARLIIKPNAMPLITEIVTALIVNRLALALSW